MAYKEQVSWCVPCHDFMLAPDSNSGFHAAKGKLMSAKIFLDFSWNPFGLQPRVHEVFTRRIFHGSKVELINCSSEDWQRQVKGNIDMGFFDASHPYEDEKVECEWAKSVGIKIIPVHDYGNPNPRFSVPLAVDEVFGKGNIEVAGMCRRVKW